MKKNKPISIGIRKKLKLNKQTVSMLNDNSMQNVLGGSVIIFTGEVDASFYINTCEGSRCGVVNTKKKQRISQK